MDAVGRDDVDAGRWESICPGGRAGVDGIGGRGAEGCMGMMCVGEAVLEYANADRRTLLTDEGAANGDRCTGDGDGDGDGDEDEDED